MEITPISIIAGPCSLNEYSEQELLAIGEISINGRPIVDGFRGVGLKSRTQLVPNETAMGMDYTTFVLNQKIIREGGGLRDLTTPPSIHLAKSIIARTGMLLASEIMNDILQYPVYARELPEGKFMPWYPSVMQLGWQMTEAAHYAVKYGWPIGIKNPKWENMEETWVGLPTYLGEASKNAILIHRGMESATKGDWRNLPNHDLARRVKAKTGLRMYYDPSHTNGPKRRDFIATDMVNAAKIITDSGEYLYDGLLVEVGTSTTDTLQHISLLELKEALVKIAGFRDIITPHRN